VPREELRPSNVTFLSATAFASDGERYQLLGLKDSGDPDKRKRAEDFLRNWFRGADNRLAVLNASNPLTTADGVHVVWIMPWVPGRLAYLNEQLMETGLVELDIAPYAGYSFKVEGKSGPTFLAWQDCLQEGKKHFDSGKPPVDFGWLEPADDPSIVVSESHSTIHGNTIENGDAYDHAAVDIGNYQKVVVPDTARLRREGSEKKLQLFMRKHLGFHGHPPQSMSIRAARKNMGCAVKDDDGTLVLATFGEWSSIEGGANMEVEVLVPEGLEVGTRGGLSGPESAGREWHGAYLTKPKELKEGWWYGPAAPAEGWKAVPDVPDALRRAFAMK
jgi:hypothetical protein